MSEFSFNKAVLVVALLATSCTGKQYVEKADEVVAVPDSYGDVEVGAAPALEGWCSDFGSPELETLVDQAFTDNLDLRAAWARLEQSEAVRAQARATLWPAISADANVGVNRSSSLGLTFDPDTGAPVVQSTAEIGTSYRTSLGAAYEVDLWGRLSAQRQAANYDTLAVRADVEALAITITSQVAEAWFDAVAQQEKIELLESQLEIAEKYLELTQLRLSQGVATALDVNQQDQQIENLRGQLVNVRAQQRIALSRLAVLLGDAPANGPQVATASLPELPPVPGAGAPSELLERRPDIRAAYLRLHSADARTASAARDKLPKLNLSASLFFQASEIGNLLDDIFWSITGAVSQSVFQGGRKNAVQRQAEAAAKAQLYAYAKTVVQAFADVYNALVLESSQSDFLEHLENQRSKAQIALDLARERYRSGSLDYLRVLTSLQSVQQLESALVDARRQQISTRISLCRALGGSWTQDLSAPADSDDGAQQ